MPGLGQQLLAPQPCTLLPLCPEDDFRGLLVPVLVSRYLRISGRGTIRARLQPPPPHGPCPGVCFRVFGLLSLLHEPPWPSCHPVPGLRSPAKSVSKASQLWWDMWLTRAHLSPLKRTPLFNSRPFIIEKKYRS